MLKVVSLLGSVVLCAGPDGAASLAKLSHRVRILDDTVLPAFSPPSLKVGSFGPATRLPHTNGSSVAWAAPRRNIRNMGVAKSNR